MARKPEQRKYLVTGGVAAVGEKVTGPAKLRGPSVKVVRPDGRAVTVKVEHLAEVTP